MTAVTNVPADTPLADELADEDLVEMANLPEEDTGISGTIFVSTRMGRRGPRVKALRWPGGGSAAELLGDDRRPATGGGEQPAGPRRQTARSAGLRVGRSQP